MVGLSATGGLFSRDGAVKEIRPLGRPRGLPLDLALTAGLVGVATAAALPLPRPLPRPRPRALGAGETALSVTTGCLPLLRGVT